MKKWLSVLLALLMLLSLAACGKPQQAEAEKPQQSEAAEPATAEPTAAAKAERIHLAAPQIGILRRVVVVVDADDQMVELVNPELIHTEGEQTGLEGCLSVPGKYGVVTRPYKATVRAQDRNGNFFEMEGEEIVARCFCHEIEHLDGHLFVEHADRLYTIEELEAMEEQNR